MRFYDKFRVRLVQRIVAFIISRVIDHGRARARDLLLYVLYNEIRLICDFRGACLIAADSEKGSEEIGECDGDGGEDDAVDEQFYKRESGARSPFLVHNMKYIIGDGLVCIMARGGV